jgi:excinuclease ABC subunit A
MRKAIVARGIRVHNLKGIDVSIPTERLVVVTGVSGSGKSSLAFDTLYAEGQRRYVESLSAFARQFLERLEKPALDSVDGMCPAVAIKQRSTSRNPRSTVATATEVHDHLRLLFARAGRVTCEGCGAEVARDTPESAAERLRGRADGSYALVGFSLAVGGTPRGDLLEHLQKRGFRRLLQDGAPVTVEALAESERELSDPCIVLVDRVKLDENASSRLAEALEAAFREGGGTASVTLTGGPTLRFSDRFDCGGCGRAYEEPQPQLFSFNSPRGACPTCHGFGNLIEIDQTLVIPDPERSLADGAVEPWNRPHYRALRGELKRFARRRGIPMDVAWKDLAEEHRRPILEGDEEFPGVVGFFRSLETKKYKVQVRVFLSRYRGYQTCPTCQGGRLRAEARAVRVGERNIEELTAFSVEGLGAFLAGWKPEERHAAVVERVRSELQRRLKFLADVGLGYLTLDRPFASLSGGESQRIALAGALSSGLRGTLYVLDEPSVGLHPCDTERLVGMLKALRDQGNTVLVVEHDRAIMAEADHVIDLGPGAGEQGGRVVFQGSYEELLRDGRGLTGKCLRGEVRTPMPRARRKGNGLWLHVRNARAHNLKGVDARIPLGAMTCVTGVSGSGKSTLVHDVITAALLKRLGRWDRAVGAHDAIEGASYVDDVVLVDQSPIGRTPRSNPVTYVKAFDGIRELFAATAEARERGLPASHFSFNVPGGRCETCAGDGQVKIDMQFLADVHLPCEACQGRRYRPPVLEVRYRGRTIDQVLDLTVSEALHFFAGQPKVARRLRLFADIGLGYLRLGQAATTLSGGEAQRIKLASHLARRPGERILYVLDEPTTGLHLSDVDELLACFRRLLEAGATLLVIEHNMDVVKHADWVLDLGPEGGDAGGRLLFQGTPEGLAVHEPSRTAPFVHAALDGAVRPLASLA